MAQQLRHNCIWISKTQKIRTNTQDRSENEYELKKITPKLRQNEYSECSTEYQVLVKFKKKGIMFKKMDIELFFGFQSKTQT